MRTQACFRSSLNQVWRIIPVRKQQAEGILTEEGRQAKRDTMQTLAQACVSACPVCMHVCSCVCMQVHVCICDHVCVYVCIHVSVCVCMCVHACTIAQRFCSANLFSKHQLINSGKYRQSLIFHFLTLSHLLADKRIDIYPLKCVWHISV